jgi:hypothetical protein
MDAVILMIFTAIVIGLFSLKPKEKPKQPEMAQDYRNKCFERWSK